MIQPNELRLNNLFSHHGKIKKVFSISQTGVFGTDIENGHAASSCTFEEMEHIEVEEILLLNFGGKLIADGPYCDKLAIKFFKEAKSVVWSGGHCFKELPNEFLKISERAEYIHQFQNILFDLTGEELEIKNPH